MNKIIATLISKEHAERMGFAYRPYLDMAIAYRRTSPDNTKFQLLSNEAEKDSSVDMNEIHEIAMQNLMQEKPGFMRMPIFETMFAQEDTAEPYGIGKFGASLLLNPEILKDLAKEYKNGFYILPSSIHEVIILPADINRSGNIEGLTDLVREINGNTDIVPADEKLSDSVYVYDKNTQSLVIAD